MTLFWQHFRAQLTGLLTWLGATAFLTFTITWAAPAAAEENKMQALMERLPAHLQAVAGYAPDLAPIDSYVGAKLGSVVPILLAMYAALLALAVVTREVDRRTIDFLLALPVQRAHVLLARLTVLAVNTGLVAISLWLVLRLGLGARGLQVSWGAYGLIFLNSWLLSIAIGGVVLLTSLRINDYSFGVKLWMGLIAGSFFLEMVLRGAGLSRLERLFSPFRYADSIEVLKHGAIPLADWIVPIVVALVSIGLSFPIFERKQITA